MFLKECKHYWSSKTKEGSVFLFSKTYILSSKFSSCEEFIEEDKEKQIFFQFYLTVSKQK